MAAPGLLEPSIDFLGSFWTCVGDILNAASTLGPTLGSIHKSKEKERIKTIQNMKGVRMERKGGGKEGSYQLFVMRIHSGCCHY